MIRRRIEAEIRKDEQMKQMATNKFSLQLKKPEHLEMAICTQTFRIMKKRKSKYFNIAKDPFFLEHKHIVR